MNEWMNRLLKGLIDKRMHGTISTQYIFNWLITHNNNITCFLKKAYLIIIVQMFRELLLHINPSIWHKRNSLNTHIFFHVDSSNTHTKSRKIWDISYPVLEVNWKVKLKCLCLPFFPLWVLASKCNWDLFGFMMTPPTSVLTGLISIGTKII